MFASILYIYVNYYFQININNRTYNKVIRVIK